MIVDLPDTTTNDINKRITSLREEGGAITLGRVLTLVVAPDRRRFWGTPSTRPSVPTAKHRAGSSSSSRSNRTAAGASGRPVAGRRRRRRR